MQATVLTPHPPKHVRLEVESFDSSPEFSFMHWVELSSLIENEDELEIELNDTAVLPELEPAVWN